MAEMEITGGVPDVVNVETIGNGQRNNTNMYQTLQGNA